MTAARAARLRAGSVGSLRPRALGLAAAAVLLGASAPALGQGRPLHERVEDPRRAEGPLLDQPAEGQNPAALRVGGREIDEPGHTDALGRGELPLRGGEEQEGALGRIERFRPDLATDSFPEQLRYTATFEPSVSPHKRLSVLDLVGADYVLGVSGRALEEVPVGGQAEAGRELFWGSVVVDLARGRPAPIPSVAAGARLLSVRSTPALRVRFYRDGADNYFVLGEQDARVRLVFVTDGPSSYFGGPLPPAPTAADVPAALRPRLPAQVRAAALGVAGELGLDPAAPVARNLARLVAYLRAFEARPLAVGPGADPYIALALGRRGVCRHRAFVFVVTAQALGIPARFVSNEAHAFAEAYVPGVGWRRIELGGAGPLADPSSAVVRHEPEQRDPFPWPRGQAPPGTSAGAREASGSGPGARPPAATPAGLVETLASRRVGGRPGEGDAGASEAGTAATAAAPEPEPEPPPAGRALLESHSEQVVRGEALAVSGRVEDRRGAVAGATVVLWLRRADGADAVRLGQTVADGSGRFAARVAVPADLPAGDYAVSVTLGSR